VSSRLWVLFALFIVYATTIPFNFIQDPAQVRAKLAAIQWNPLKRTDGRRLAIPDAVQNVMLFIPFGMLGALACRRGITSRPGIVAVVGAAGTGLSAFVETLQLLTVDRVASMSDVMTNGLGAAGGALVALEGRRRALGVMRAHARSPWLTNRWTYPTLCALGVLVVSAWQPFDLTLDVSTVGSKARALSRDPWQQGPWTDEGSAVVLYALTTLAVANWLEASGAALAPLKAALTVAVLAIGLESSQALVGSRTPSAWDAAVRLAGVAVGVALVPATRAFDRRRPWLAILFAACVASAAILSWGPFAINAERQPFTWFPFLGYYGSNWFPAVSHVIELALVYFPFSFVLGMSRPPGQAMKAAALMALGAAIVIEYGQSWFVGRYADVTDVAFSALGGGLGAWFSGRGADLFEKTRASATARGSR